VTHRSTRNKAANVLALNVLSQVGRQLLSLPLWYGGGGGGGVWQWLPVYPSLQAHVKPSWLVP
jgi:hypothetical protein